MPARIAAGEAYQLDQLIQRLLVSICEFALRTIVARIILQEFVDTADGFESGGEFFCFLGKDAVGRQPIMEAQIRLPFRKSARPIENFTVAK
jgi:hypothetical protein